MIYRCFVIMPFGPKYDEVYDAIRFSAQRMPGEIQVQFVRADERALMSDIEGNVTQHIATCDLAVADLSENNPNVVYEVGHAQATGKPVVLITSRDDTIPSTLRDRHFLRYDSSALETLSARLPSFLAAAVSAGRQVSRSGSFVTTGYTSIDAAELSIALKMAVAEFETLAPALYPMISDLGVEIRRALERSVDFRVRILALDPESAFVNFRAQQLARVVSSYRDELRHALASVMELLSAYGDRCELRLFDDLPSYYLYRVDHSLFISLMAPLRSSRGGLTFRLETNDPGADSVLNGFDTLWAKAAPVTPGISLPSNRLIETDQKRGRGSSPRR